MKVHAPCLFWHQGRRLLTAYRQIRVSVANQRRRSVQWEADELKARSTRNLATFAVLISASGLRREVLCDRG